MKLANAINGNISLSCPVLLNPSGENTILGQVWSHGDAPKMNYYIETCACILLHACKCTDYKYLDYIYHNAT